MGHTYRENLYLNRKERVGLIILFGILFGFLLIPHLWNNYFKTNAAVIAKYSSIPVEHQSKNQHTHSSTPSKQYLNKPKTKQNSNNLFEFDPNTLQLADALKLGIPKYAFNNLSKYRNKGGKIKSSNDLLKIYGMPKQLVTELSKYMMIPQKLKTNDTIINIKNEIKFNPISANININSATVDELIPLPGIALKLSERIIKYRNSIGGFSDLNQLLEVYGLPDSTLKKITPYLYCDGVIAKIKINSIDSEDLSEHPFFTKKQAQFIINYRTQHERITSIDELRQTNYFTNEWLQKINKYLDFIEN